MRLFWISVLVMHQGLAWAGPAKPTRHASTTTTSAEVMAVQKANVVFPKKKMKISEFLKNLEGKIPANYLEQLKEKGKPILNESMEFENLGGAKFALRANGSEALIEVLSFADGKFKINNRTATIDFKLKPALLWEDVQKLLVKQTAMNPVMLILMPEAQAFFEGFWPIAIGVGVVGIVGWLYNSHNCDKYKNFEAACSASSTCVTKQLWVDMTNHDTGWLNLAMGCDAEKSLARSCFAGKIICEGNGAGASSDKTSGSLNGYTPAGTQ